MPASISITLTSPLCHLNPGGRIVIGSPLARSEALCLPTREPLQDNTPHAPHATHAGYLVATYCVHVHHISLTLNSTLNSTRGYSGDTPARIRASFKVRTRQSARGKVSRKDVQTEHVGKTWTQQAKNKHTFPFITSEMHWKRNTRCSASHLCHPRHGLLCQKEEGGM